MSDIYNAGLGMMRVVELLFRFPDSNQDMGDVGRPSRAL